MVAIDEIPNSQIKDAADQFADGAKLLHGLPPFSGVLLPTVNAAIIACELYLKSLNAKTAYSEPNSLGVRQVFAVPAKKGHPLAPLFSGRSRQCAALPAIQRIASTNNRLSTPLRPGVPARPGK